MHKEPLFKCEYSFSCLLSFKSSHHNNLFIYCREGLINNNPYTVTKTIVEFTLTFDQNAISPDAKLLSKVRATKRLDEMPVYPKSLKVNGKYFTSFDLAIFLLNSLLCVSSGKEVFIRKKIQLKCTKLINMVKRGKRVAVLQ